MLELGTADPPRRGPFPCACSQLPTPLLLLPAASSCFPSPSFFTRFWGLRSIQTPHGQVFPGFRNAGFTEVCTGWVLLSQFGLVSPKFRIFLSPLEPGVPLSSTKAIPGCGKFITLGKESQRPWAALGSGQPLLFQRNLFQYSHS